MDKQRNFRRALLAAVLGAFGVGGLALAIDEIEFNHPISSAQQLIIEGGTVTVNGVVGNLTGPMILDADFYSFYARAGDVVTFDIDGGIKTTGRSLDAILTLFGPETYYENDDIPSSQRLDDGSIHLRDPLLANINLPKSGIYTIAVTGFPNKLNRDGTFKDTRSFSQTNGGYTLIISGVSPYVQQINIEIKPGSGESAPINPKSKGNIPVALLSSAEFNALDIDVASLTFGATGDEASYKRCGNDGLDVNGDGRLDRVCHFENQLAGFDVDHSMGIVKGKTKPAAGGTPFEGRGMLKVVPAKRQD